MALETATIEHSCNVVRRQVQEEFPDLTLSFIIYNKENPAKSFGQPRPEFEQHPAGPALVPAIKKAKPAETLYLIGRAREKKLVRLFAREKTLACVFFTDDNSGVKDPDYIRQQALALAWHALNTGRPKADSLLATHYGDETARAWHNMLADAFSALVMEMQGKRGFIKALARRRSALALEARAGYHPEHYPYPAVMDAAQLVYDDTRRAGGLSKTKTFAQALEMTKEIGLTFDQSTVLQWWAFAKPAQEMAWLGVDKNKILGAAVHTSEDPYARSTAYLIAESLGIDPAAGIGAGLYNAFTEQEANERHHRRLCDEVFEDLLAKTTPEHNGDIFRAEAKRQNEKLLGGQIIGWCTPGLLAAAATFDKTMAPSAKLEEVRRVFTQGCRKMNADVLRSLGHIIVSLRQSGEAVTLEKIAAAAVKDEHMIVQDLADALVL